MRHVGATIVGRAFGGFPSRARIGCSNSFGPLAISFPKVSLRRKYICNLQVTRATRAIFANPWLPCHLLFFARARGPVEPWGETWILGSVVARNLRKTSGREPWSTGDHGASLGRRPFIVFQRVPPGSCFKDFSVWLVLFCAAPKDLRLATLPRMLPWAALLSSPCARPGPFWVEIREPGSRWVSQS